MSYPLLDCLWLVEHCDVRLRRDVLVRTHHALRTIVHLDGRKNADLAGAIALHLAVNHEALFVESLQ